MNYQLRIMNGLRQHGTAVLSAAALWAANLSLAVAASPTLKIKPPQTVGTQFDTIDHVISSGFNIVLTVAGVLFMILFLLGGIQYLASAGHEEGTKKARQLLLDSVIGLVIVVMAWAVGIYVLQLLGLSDSDGTLNT